MKGGRLSVQDWNSEAGGEGGAGQEGKTDDDGRQSAECYFECVVSGDTEIVRFLLRY